MAKSIIELPRGVPDNARGWLDIFGRINKFLRVSGDELVIGGDIQLPAQSVGTTEIEDLAITNAKLRLSQGNSVIGRALSSEGAPTDIQAGGNGEFLRTAGGVLGFGAIADSDIPAGIARDTEVTAAISNHEAAVDPHPTYTTATEVATAITSSINALNLASGTYTPTLSNTTNIDNTTAYACQYMRVGSVVTVSGRLDANTTASAATTVVGISLPIASAFTAAEQCCGVAFSQTVQQGAGILADATNDRAQMEWISVDATAHGMFFTFSYQIV